MQVNAEKQMMFSYLPMNCSPAIKTGKVNRCRDAARAVLPEVQIRIEQIETSLEKNCEIVNPFKGAELISSVP